MTPEHALTPQEVIVYFGDLTGIVYRSNLIPQLIQQQAFVFARNFELWELRLVYEWTRAQIRDGERRANGFSRQSLQWHNMIADGGDPTLGRFQTRLGLATAWAKGHRRDLLRPANAEQASAPSPKPREPSPEVVAADQRHRAEAVAGFRALLEQLGGRPAVTDGAEGGS